MPFPDRDTFLQLAGNHNVIPVFKTIPADLETPVSLYLKIASHYSGSFLLESGDLGEKARYSFVGCDPALFLYNVGNATYVQEKPGKRWCTKGDPLDVLRRIIESFKPYQPDILTTFWGGAVGYLSYDLVRWWEKLPGMKVESGWPSCYFYFPSKILIYDHRQHFLTVVVLALLSNSENFLLKYQETVKELEKILNNLNQKKAELFPVIDKDYELKDEVLNEGKNGFPLNEFENAVVKAKEYINSGDIFQVVLSRRKIKKTTAHPFNVYRAMRSINPSPYQFYLSFPHFKMAGSSPEMLAKLEKGYALTRPIAGTRPRGTDERGDAQLAKELLNDEKERAEHMMLVDLGRNDLGKVCTYGSVEVNKLFEVEYFSHVMHLVSEVKGKIRPECNFASLLRAVFPAGTVSGAPKLRAMEIINELEPVARGPYAGAVGYIGFNGDMDTCITIRTIILAGERAFIQAGAGIVADSNPRKEYEETEYKMAGSLKAVELAEEWENDFDYR